MIPIQKDSHGLFLQARNEIESSTNYVFTEENTTQIHLVTELGLDLHFWKNMCKDKNTAFIRHDYCYMLFFHNVIGAFVYFSTEQIFPYAIFSYMLEMDIAELAGF